MYTGTEKKQARSPRSVALQWSRFASATLNIKINCVHMNKETINLLQIREHLPSVLTNMVCFMY
jgi:hypothetical protein